jgi:hypothetical protein
MRAIKLLKRVKISKRKYGKKGCHRIWILLLQLWQLHKKNCDSLGNINEYYSSS